MIVGGQDCYAAGNSTDFYFNVTSDLYANISFPTNARVFDRGDDILLRGNITDECKNLIPDVDTIEFKAADGSVYECPSVNNENNGYYNCTIPGTTTNMMAFTYYNVTINATKLYYNFTSNLENNAFVITTYPTLSSPSVSPGAGGWGREYTFNVTVEDLENDVVNVSLWVNTTGEWVMINSTTGQYESPTPLSFKHRFTCPDIGVNQYRFNVTDTWNSSDETTPLTFTLEEDDTFVVIIEGTDAPIDREGYGNIKLVLRIRDVDYMNQYVGAGRNGSIFITTDGSSYDAGNLNTTNSTGH